jgi:hypothetical protein
MKGLILTSLVTLFAAQAHSAMIRSAKLDSSKRNLVIDVTYGGGCGKHDFTLQVGGCLESYPVRCTAELIEKTNDMCEALVSTTVVINLAEEKLNDHYYKGGSLTILGDQDWQTKKRSQATVVLP